MEEKGAYTSIGYFLLIGDIEFLKASPVLIIRKSCSLANEDINNPAIANAAAR